MHTLSIFSPTSTFAIFITVLGGLGLFLYGIDYMSSSLKNLSGSKLKMLVGKATNNIFTGLLTGILITVLIQSSSATTVIVIGLISAGIMTLKQAIGVMMGANIGTTVTAFLIGLKISDYSLLFVGIGAIMIMFFSAKRSIYLGGIFLGFGILFIGLELMSVGLEPLTNEAWFKTAMVSLSENSVLGVLVGTVLTTIVQSSSASVGVLQQVFANGNIALPGALAVLLGCNVGTTITAILASLKSSREAKQASLFHLLFNIFGTVTFLIFFKYYVSIISYFEKQFLGINNKLTIAFAHIFFNIVITIIVLFIVKYFVILIEKILPVNKQNGNTIFDKLSYDLLESSPVLALENTKAIVIEMGEVVQNMVNTARKYQTTDDSSFYDSIASLEIKIDYYDHSIHDYLMELQSYTLTQKNKQTQILLLDTIRDFERIADHAVNLSEFYKARYDLNCPLTGNVLESLNHYFTIVSNQVNDAINCFKNNDKKLAKVVIEVEEEVDKLEKTYRRAQLINKDEEECNDIHFVDILSNLERISDHCNNIAENIIDPHYLSKERVNPTV